MMCQIEQAFFRALKSLKIENRSAMFVQCVWSVLRLIVFIALKHNSELENHVFAIAKIQGVPKKVYFFKRL